MSKKPETIKTIQLPAPKTASATSLEESIKKRRSERTFSNKDLSLAQLSQLLWAIQGITDPDWGLRSAPSAGAIYPLEIYVIKASGVFHYLPQKQALDQFSEEDLRSALSQAALGQAFVAEAPVTFIIAADFQKVRQKYGGRTERYVHIETGHAAENLLLQATAMGLGAVPVGAFWDDVVKKVINLPEDLHPIYIIPVGYPTK
ncbi:MAG: SagB/ThcOx family dehydrogenase [Candidatus Margulisbacteria bacterium]|nr:SagB/ThcOx family dehydrogenase [Candidatus Margulisiibacteriota bacterium]MBU1022297.1 SagB/ThcOx family dehydrogenase [Candidatus Margulisiibacteriota bacterium]MBU1729910.1 SagB/ThcOx family dehydrogenase [Candidatus Margulisiibacteriota bacterium]MBU1955943.1 SagB/ThcOx family dehydrogenase [Candidatus Margulisiibacteriota bacterium]